MFGWLKDRLLLSLFRGCDVLFALYCVVGSRITLSSLLERVRTADRYANSHSELPTFVMMPSVEVMGYKPEISLGMAYGHQVRCTQGRVVLGVSHRGHTSSRCDPRHRKHRIHLWRGNTTGSGTAARASEARKR